MGHKIGAFGAELELAASAVRVADGTGDAVLLNGKYSGIVVVCDFTNKATDATDLMDVFVDTLIGTVWVNVIHFTQALGNGTDSQIEIGNLTPGNQNTDVTVVTADLASGKVRPGVLGSQLRARWDFTDGGGGGAATFTFSVTAYAS